MSSGPEQTGRSPEATAPSDKRRLVTNTLVNGVSQFSTMIASLVFLPLLVNAFGLADYGLFMLASSVTAYAALLDLGVGSALTKLVAEHTAKDDREAVAGAVSSAFLFYSGIGLVVAVAMFAIGAVAGTLFDVTAGGARLLRDLLWVGAIFQLWYWPTSTARYTLAGLQRYDIIATSGIVSTLLSIGATLLVIVTGSGPVLLVALNGFIIVIVSLINVTMAVRLTRLSPASLGKASRVYIRAIFSFSWAVFVVQLSDVLFYQQTDRVLLGVFAGGVAVALYEAGAKFNSLMTFLSGLTVSAVLPLASSMGAAGRHASLRSLFFRGTKYGAALVAPATLVMIVFAGPLIEIWLGPRFAGQVIVAQVLVFPHILVSLGLMGDAIVISQGRLAKRIPYILLQAVLNVVLSALLIGRYGVLGVAIGTTVSHLIDFPIHIRFLLKETRVPLREWLREVVLPVYPLLVVPLGAGILLSRTALADTIPGIFAAAALSLALYWGAVLAVGLSPAEREDVRAAVRLLRARLRPAETR